MKNIITRYICILLAGVLIFIIGKLLFLGINASMYSHISFNDIVSLIWHGASMDLCMSAYIAAIPALTAIASPWVKPRVIDNCLKIYFGIIAAAISLCIVLDAGLYSYWQFKLDVTPFSYFFHRLKRQQLPLNGGRAYWHLLHGECGDSQFIRCIHSF